MNVSQVQLRFYLLTNIHLEPREAVGLNPPTPPGEAPFEWKGVKILSNVEFGWADAQDELRAFALKLRIVIPNTDGVPAPYTVDVGCVGYFDLIGDLSKFVPQDLAQVNGAALLYGVLRELIYANTSRFAHGPLILPSVNFLDLRQHGTSNKDGAAVESQQIPSKD